MSKWKSILLHSQDSLPPLTKFAVSEVAVTIVKNKACIVTERRGMPCQVTVSDLLLFDAFKEMDESNHSTHLHSQRFRGERSKWTSLSTIFEAVGANAVILKSLQDREKTSRLTYSTLYAELHEYTIFPEGNLCVRFNV